MRTRWTTYVEYENAEREYYDRRHDPYELHNRVRSLSAKQIARLSAALRVYRHCAGAREATAAGKIGRVTQRSSGRALVMLTLTPNAEQAVRKLVADSPISEDAGGLRIAPGQPTPEGVPLELSIVGSPEPEDKDAGAPDAHVYLEPTAAEALDDKVLDAEVEGNNIGFALLDASAPPPSNNGTDPNV